MAGEATDRVFVHGCGVVSPAGWGITAFRDALKAGEPLPIQELARPGWSRGLSMRMVPPAKQRDGALGHPRLRRVSPISQFAVAAAAEALGAPRETERIGIITCVLAGCVNYSRRFYDEVLREPATASPLLFPETVFNAPGSHVGAVFGATHHNYTLVGAPGVMLQALALGADWLLAGQLDGCLVIGAEEHDWLTANAFHPFSRRVVLGEGAGALYLRREREGAWAELAWISDAYAFLPQRSRPEAARQLRAGFPRAPDPCLLCHGLQGVARFDRDEDSIWADWTGPRCGVKPVLGEGLLAAAAWQCVAAVDALREGCCVAANVSVIGCHQEAVGAQFGCV